MKDSIFWDITSWYLLSVSCWFLAWFTLEPWRWMQYLPPKDRLIFTGLLGVISQKTELFKESYVCPLRYLRIGTKAWGVWTYLKGICRSVEIGGTQGSYWRPSAVKDDARCWSWNLWTTSGAEERLLPASFTLATSPLLAAVYSILCFLNSSWKWLCVLSSTVDCLALMLRNQVTHRSNFCLETACSHWAFSWSVLVPLANAEKVLWSRLLNVFLRLLMSAVHFCLLDLYYRIYEDEREFQFCVSRNPNVW
jgi:hypothetical protein